MDRVCPMLGLAGDRRVAVDGVDTAHRCHADSPADPLDRQTQAQLCLTASYDRCERYLRFVARTGARTPGRSSLGDGLVSTRQLLAPQPAWRGVAGRARRARALPLVAAGIGVLAVGGGAAAVATSLVGAPGAAAVASPSARPTPSATAGPTVALTQRPTASPSPTPTPSPAPTPIPATPVPVTPIPATPAPVAPAPRTYVVQAGDNLAAIAQRFGTTTAALQQANGIEDPNEIFVGQVLTIP